MGKASSNKKVARAAGIGGSRVHRRQTPWGYFGIIALIVVLGVAGTWVSRDRRNTQINNAGNTAPTVGTQWYEGYGVYICGKFLPPFSTKSPDPEGITTTISGVINILPKTRSAAGHNATLGKFATAVGMKLNAAEIQAPGGHLYLDDATCEGKQGHVYVREFAGPSDTVGTLYDGAKGGLPKLDPRDVPLKDNYLLTIAFVPSDKASSIPPPPASVLSALSAAEQAKNAASSSSTTTPSIGTPPTSVAPTTATTKPTSSTTAKP